MEKIDLNILNTEGFLKEQKKRDEIFTTISHNIQDKNFDHEEVQKHIGDLYNWMNKFYDCSIPMFKGLAEVYETNHEFSEILIRNYGENMPTYLAKAIVYYCNNYKK